MARKKLKQNKIAIAVILAIVAIVFLSYLSYTGHVSMVRDMMGQRPAPSPEFRGPDLSLSSRIDGLWYSGVGVEDQNSTIWFLVTNNGDVISNNISVEVWNYGLLLGRLETNYKVRPAEMKGIGLLTIVPPDAGLHKFNFKLCDGTKCKDSGFELWYILDATQARYGNGNCESDIGENAFNSRDCVGRCGNGRCEPGFGEHPHNCPQDCG